jgi:hypothetical protein
LPASNYPLGSASCPHPRPRARNGARIHTHRVSCPRVRGYLTPVAIFTRARGALKSPRLTRQVARRTRPAGRAPRRTASPSAVFSPCATYHGRHIRHLRRARASPIKVVTPYLARLSTTGPAPPCSPSCASRAPPPSGSSTRDRRRPSCPYTFLGPTEAHPTALSHGRASTSPETPLPRQAPGSTAKHHRRPLLRPNSGRKRVRGEPLVLFRPFPGRERRRLAGIPAGRAALTSKGYIARSQLFPGLFL